MKRKLAYFGLYTGLLLWVLGMSNIARVAAQNYTNQYYTHLINSLIDSTPIGSTTPSFGVFNWSAAVSDSTSPTAQGAYTMFNLGGVGDYDLVDIKGGGSAGWYFWNGFGNLTAHLTPSSFFLPGITLASAPSLCPNGEKASGIDVNGNATGCSVAFTQAAIISGCSTGSNTYDTCGPLTVTWPSAFADTNYAPVCFAQDANAGPGSSGSNESGIVYADAINTTGMSVWVQNNRGSFPFSPSHIFCQATHP